MKKIIILIILTQRALVADSITSLIDSPGVWIYGGNIIANPTDNNDAIITISSSNVVVDLGEHLITQQANNTASNLLGILIEPNLNNITIRNGFIENLTGNGIYINDGCSNIFIENMGIGNCDTAGIVFDGKATGSGITGSYVTACTLLACKSAQGNSVSGVLIKNCSGISVYDSECSYNSVSNNDAYGIRIENSNQCELKKCICKGNTGNVKAAGISLYQSTDSLINKCISFENSVIANDSSALAAGILLQSCLRINCNESKCIGNLALAGGQSFGFYTQKGYRTAFEECVGELNSSQALSCGFYLEDETRAEIINCTSRGNNSLTNICCGVSLNGSCSSCYVYENLIIGNTGAQKTFGIVDYASPSTSVYIRNQAFNNESNYSVSYPNGITLPLINGSLSDPAIDLPANAQGVLDNISISL